MDWAEEHPHLLKKRGGDPPGQHPSMTRKEAMKWAHIDQGARQKQHALRKLEARSDATSQDAAQWAGEHPAFLKEHPKLASSVTEAGGHPFLMKRLMAGGPNQGSNQPNQGPMPQQQQDAPLIADAPSQQQQSQSQTQQLIRVDQQSSQPSSQQQPQQQSQQSQQQQPATRPHKSQQSLSEIIRGIIHAPEQQQQQQAAAQLSSKVMTQQEQWLQEPVNGNTAPQQQQQRGAVDATQLRKQEGLWVSQPLTASEGAAPASQQDAAILKQMLKPIEKPYRRTEGATASGRASMVALPQLETHLAKQQQAQPQQQAQSQQWQQQQLFQQWQQSQRPSAGSARPAAAQERSGQREGQQQEGLMRHLEQQQAH